MQEPNWKLLPLHMKRNESLFLVSAYIIVVTFTNFLSVLFYRFFELDFVASYSSGIKDSLLFLLALTLLFSSIYRGSIAISRPARVILYLIITIFLVHCLYFMLSNASLTCRLINLRRDLALLGILAIGTFLPVTKQCLDRLIKLIVFLCILTCLFGLFEYLVGDWFWDQCLAITKYWSAKQLDPFGKNSISESGRFYSYDLYFLFGKPIRRLVSFFIEPTITSGFLSLGLIVLFFAPLRIRMKPLIISLLLVSGLLTQSKAFVLALIVVLYFRYMGSLNSFLLIILSFFFVVPGWFLEKMERVSGPFSHIYGYYTGLKSIIVDNPMGAGLGEAGNYSDAVMHGVALAQHIIGGESGQGNVYAQIGIWGLLYPALAFAILICSKIMYRKTLSNYYYIGFVAIFSWYLVFMNSASGLSFTGFFLHFLVTGLLFNNRLTAQLTHCQVPDARCKHAG
jgi:hypothetical protein